MAFLDDFANEFVPRSSVSPLGLELENILEVHGVSWQITDEMIALEVETHRRCFPAQPALSASQRYNRRKCALLLRDLAAAANLPLFSQQLLDLTHRGWSERADSVKLHSERYPGPHERVTRARAAAQCTSAR